MAVARVSVDTLLPAHREVVGHVPVRNDEQMAGSDRVLVRQRERRTVRLDGLGVTFRRTERAVGWLSAGSGRRTSVMSLSPFVRFK
jgi:hypothetical protein